MNYYKFEGGFNIKRLIIIGSVLLLVSYGIFNARNLIMGPEIEIFSPNQNIETGQNVVAIKGKVKNMTFLSLNQKPIFVDMEGLFEEKLLLSPGSNIIEIKATDRFKNEIQKTIQVYYKEATTTNET